MRFPELQQPVKGVRTAGCFSADRHREADGPAQELGRRPGDQILDLFHRAPGEGVAGADAQAVAVQDAADAPAGLRREQPLIAQGKGAVA